MRLVAATVSLLTLAACAAQVPDSGAGADDTNGAGLPGAASVESRPLDSEGAAIAAETSAVLGLNGDAAQQQTSTGAPMSAMRSDSSLNDEPTEVAVEEGTPVTGAAISDEQNFQAVAERETIQSDAERLAENRAKYVVIEPTDLPQREDGNGASIVKYALATNNAVGEQLYSRSGFNAEARFERNCARYSHSDLAQEAFLDAGGPQSDRMGLDPDGDGFACYWDPAPFRAARQAASNTETADNTAE
jgi:hypothetical protein